MIEVTTSALASHRFLRGMPNEYLRALTASASDVRFPAGHRIFEEGQFAGKFWLIQSGRVALDMSLPGVGRVVVDRLGMGELVGCSWLFPPYRWAFGAVCASPLEAFEFDAGAVRSRCAADPVFGYELTRRLIPVFAARLQATRRRLIVGSRQGDASS